MGRGPAQRPPSVRILGGDLPHEHTRDRADEQRDTDERRQQRSERDRQAKQRGAAERDVKGVGLGKNGIAHEHLPEQT
jgi:hypothetical protein